MLHETFINTPARDHDVRQRSGAPTVAVVITTYNHAHFLDDAIQSVLAQTRPADDIIVVDDGSSDDPAAVVARYPVIRLVVQSNQGLAAARNTGTTAATSDMIVFLDADDRLLPQAIEAGLACYARAPESGFVYGGYQLIEADGRPRGHVRYRAASAQPYHDILRGNAVAMHATVMYRRDRLMELGGFHPDLRCCEDYDVYLRMAERYPIASHPGIIAEYRQHNSNMSQDNWNMLRTVLLVHDRHRSRALKDSATADAWKRGRSFWRRCYGERILRAGQFAWRRDRDLAVAIMTVCRVAWIAPGSLMSIGRSVLKSSLPATAIHRLKRLAGHHSAPPFGKVDFGDLGSTQPISDQFGFDRGTPIDRYYIEAFLANNSADIGGRVLEVGDASYTRKFGGARVVKSDVLHVRSGIPGVTIVADLSVPDCLPREAFDCLIITQTLHLIYDMRQAASEMFQALRPGGTLLVTVPGLSQIDHTEWGAMWYWSLTALAAQRLFSDVFGCGHVRVEAFGNVFSAIAFLQGVAAEEVDRAKLDVCDAAYPVTIAIRAMKPLDA